MKTELQQIQQPEFLEVVNKSGIETTKAHQHAQAFAPSMAQYSEIATVLSTLDKTIPEHAKIARENRLKMVKVRTGAEAIKDERKANLITEGNLIQGLFNVVKATCQLTEADFEAIEKHAEKVEADRKAKLAATRLELCIPYEIDTTYLPLSEMTDEQFDRCLESGKLAFEARIEAARKAEEDRLRAEQEAEDARIEAERLQAERIENERLEAIRIKAEKEELERKLEQDRIIAEKQQQEIEKRAAADLAEKQKQQDRQSAMFSLGLKWDGQTFIYKDINFHWTDLLCMSDSDFQKALTGATKRMEALKAEEKSAEDAKQAEQDRVAAELKAKLDAENAAIAAKQALATASDKVKIRALYEAIKAMEIPTLTSDVGIDIATTAREAIDALLKTIIAKSKNLI